MKFELEADYYDPETETINFALLREDGVRYCGQLKPCSECFRVEDK